MEKDSRNVVWEHKEGGTRFMTPYTPGEEYKDNEHHKLIAENLTYKDALLLVKETETKNIRSFLNTIPEELRDPDTDAFIADMLRSENGEGV
jgi:hypothetical protein